jgi:hypothetical protein
LLTVLCILGAALFVNEARAQCSAKDVLRKILPLDKTRSAARPPRQIASATAAPVWRTITLGTIANKFVLRNALVAADCGIGDEAQDILSRPSLTLSATKTNIDLVALSVAELGLRAETASLADIYARAKKLGFRLAAAEVGPQLRLQYFDQPIGEFLNVGMEPIETSGGKAAIFVLVNGGGGLVLISGSANTEFYASSRSLFVRPANVAAAQKE